MVALLVISSLLAAGAIAAVVLLRSEVKRLDTEWRATHTSSMQALEQASTELNLVGVQRMLEATEILEVASEQLAARDKTIKELYGVIENYALIHAATRKSDDEAALDEIVAAAADAERKYTELSAKYTEVSLQRDYLYKKLEGEKK